MTSAKVKDRSLPARDSRAGQPASNVGADPSRTTRWSSLVAAPALEVNESLALDCDENPVGMNAVPTSTKLAAIQVEGLELDQAF